MKHSRAFARVDKLCDLEFRMQDLFLQDSLHNSSTGTPSTQHEENPLTAKVRFSFGGWCILREG